MPQEMSDTLMAPVLIRPENESTKILMEDGSGYITGEAGEYILVEPE